MECGIEDDPEGHVEIDGDAEVNESEDYEKANFLKCPGQPSAQEEEDHRCSHIPFRSWCRYCMMGRGLGTPHLSSQGQSSIPRVGLDYFYITSGGIKKEDELG